jgi:hypothetical protein
VNINYQDVQLGRIDFISQKHGNTLYYNDTAVLNIEIVNPGNRVVKDLILSIDAAQNTNNLLFNSIVMINLDKSMINKQVSIEIIADETIKNQSMNFNISLKNPEKNILDAENISFQTIGISSYSNDYTTNTYQPESQNNYNPDSGTTQNSQFNQNATGCGKSCVISGLVSVLIGVILTLL